MDFIGGVIKTGCDFSSIHRLRSFINTSIYGGALRGQNKVFPPDRDGIRYAPDPGLGLDIARTEGFAGHDMARKLRAQIKERFTT